MAKNLSAFVVVWWSLGVSSCNILSTLVDRLNPWCWSFSHFDLICSRGLIVWRAEQNTNFYPLFELACNMNFCLSGIPTWFASKRLVFPPFLRFRSQQLLFLWFGWRQFLIKFLFEQFCNRSPRSCIMWLSYGSRSLAMLSLTSRYLFYYSSPFSRTLNIVDVKLL